MYSLRFREELPGRMADELDGMIAAIRNVFYAEHNEEGQHLDAAPEAALVPVGSGQIWYTNTPPDRWLLCNGQAVSRVTYNRLFKVIGTQFGAGDGVLTFNLPNLTSRFPRGNSGTLGSTGGSSSHSHSIDSDGSHDHGGNTGSSSPNTGPPDTTLTVAFDAGGPGVAGDGHEHDVDSHSHSIGSSGSHDHDGSTGSASSLPPYVNVNYVIFAGG